MRMSILLIFIPLIIGYLLPSISTYWQIKVNQYLSIVIYAILFLMGINLAFLPNLTNNLLRIGLYSTISAVCILSMNLLALSIIEKILPWQGISSLHIYSRWKIFFELIKLSSAIIVGFILGLSHVFYLKQATKIIDLLLILVLWLVGVQLRNSKIKISQIIFNQRGLFLTLIVLTSSLFGGVITAFLLGLPLYTGLALASSYGWYSLSSVMMTDAFGMIIGSTAFFNDLLREILAIMFIPILMRRWHNTALGLCGATSMDSTLPLLQRSGGMAVVPAAIVQGFLLSILAPILISIFSLHISG